MLLVVAVRAPLPPAGLDAVRGHRVFGPPVEEIALHWNHRDLHARRRDGRWRIEDRAAPAPVAAALDDLADTLSGLRALDAFRPRDGAGYGLDDPHGSIELRGSGHAHRLVVGGLNAAGSAYYARRDDEARVLQIGSGIDSAVDRVFYAVDNQRPEIG